MLNSKNLTGTWTALATPFSADTENIDSESLGNLVQVQLAAQVNGLVVCGSTAEAQTLSDEEYQAVVKQVVSQTKRQVPIIAAIGTSSTRRACEMAYFLDSSGVDGILLTAPPYNKPSQEGLSAHYAQVKAHSALPIVAYNIPGRSAVNILPATLASLYRDGIIIGVKEASAVMDQIMDLVAATDRDFALLSGEDSLVQAIMSCGGKGVISASANVAPNNFLRITSQALAGDIAASLEAQLEILPLVRALFSETNPIPVKAALALQGVIKYPTVRLPLTPAKPETVQKLKGLLNL